MSLQGCIHGVSYNTIINNDIDPEIKLIQRKRLKKQISQATGSLNSGAYAPLQHISI
jgi:hypothetical protein